MKKNNVRVSIDGEVLQELEVREDDLYQLWKGEFGRRVLELDVDEGVRIHAFTFGR